MIRQKELCSGEAHCPNRIVLAQDQDGLATEVDRCHECPLFKLEAELEKPVGGVISRAKMLGYALEKGFQINLREVLCDEFNALRILDEEHAKYDADVERSRNPHE